jgi:hypothetical protein
MTQNTFKAVVRSLTPWVIAAVVWVVTHLGFHISLVTATQVASIIGTALTIGAHYLETKWKWFGVFLGWLGAPAYVPSVSKKQLASQVDVLTSQLNAINSVIASAPTTLPPGSPVA